MAAWLATRLTNGMGELTGSIPTTLKTLTIISAMAEKSSVFRAAALENCTAAVGAAQTFNRVDPVHGDKPAELVRSNAEKLTALLNKKEGAAALLSMGGGLLSRGKAKAAEAAKMAEDRGRQAAKFADEKAREAAKLAEEKAGQAKAAAADGSMLGAVTAAGGSVVSSRCTQLCLLAHKSLHREAEPSGVGAGVESGGRGGDGSGEGRGRAGGVRRLCRPAQGRQGRRQGRARGGQGHPRGGDARFHRGGRSLPFDRSAGPFSSVPSACSVLPASCVLSRCAFCARFDGLLR